MASETMVEGFTEPRPELTAQAWADLLPALTRLDALLEQALTQAETVYGPEAAADLYRGLYVSQDQAVSLLKQRPGQPLFAFNGQGNNQRRLDAEWLTQPPLQALQQQYELSTFELDLILIALAPELDRRYERIYAYLQDHVSRRWPSVDLALNLLCANAVERLERRSHFAPHAPLFRHQILHLLPDPQGNPSSLLAQSFQLDEQIVRLLLDQRTLDTRLAPFCGWQDELKADASAALLHPRFQSALGELAESAQKRQRALRLYFQKTPGSGADEAAIMLANRLEMPLLRVNLDEACQQTTNINTLWPILFREVRRSPAILYLDQVETLMTVDRTTAYRSMLAELAADNGITILAGIQPWQPIEDYPLGIVDFKFPVPDYKQRYNLWQHFLTQAGLETNAEIVEVLAARFRLNAGQIAEAAAAAGHQVAGSTNKLEEHETFTTLLTFARRQTGGELAALARKVDPLYTWDDIILPADSLDQLREICQRVVQHRQVLTLWGFERKLSLGKGISALFAGPSGTGKTMAAEIIANEIGLELYQIDLAGVVSKYIGETEKNLDRIFTAAENANAILFFDEADALFGKRSEVRDSHDRYANVEISYLLQRMEAYDGITILATNLRQNLDEAFTRRLTFTVHFPFPDETSRRQIWRGIWPTAVPLDPGVDLNTLAERFKLSGGNIKNVALTAAYLAAADNCAVTPGHIYHAVRREYQKMGKALTEPMFSQT